MDNERRRAQRHPFIASAEVEDLAVGSRLPTRISDISAGGCYVDTVNPFPDGTGVRVKIFSGTQHLKLARPWRIRTRIWAWALVFERWLPSIKRCCKAGCPRPPRTRCR